MILLGCLWLAVALLGAPLFLVLGGCAWFLFHTAGIDPSALIIELYRLASAPTLVTIPLFTFSGYVLAASQAPQRLVRCTRALLGWLPGGLALVALGSCAFFTAFTGASGMTIVAMGGLLLPVLLEERYPESFSLGLLTTCGSIGLLFPPSLPVILYALIAHIRLDLLFLAGAVPCCLLLMLLALFSSRQAWQAGVPTRRSSWREIRQSLWAARWELLVAPLILGGMYGGFVTVNEAAVVTAAYSVFMTTVLHRDLHLGRDIPALITQSAVVVGAIFIILGTALGLTSYLVDSQLPMHLLDAIQGSIQSRIVFLLALNGLLLLVGCLMDIFSAIVIIVPLLLPIAAQFDIHPLHLGIIVLTNLEIGYSTPPVGLNLFLGSLRFERPIGQLYRASWPFLLLLLLGLGLITYVPALTLGLVHLRGDSPALVWPR